MISDKLEKSFKVDLLMLTLLFFENFTSVIMGSDEFLRHINQLICKK